MKLRVLLLSGLFGSAAMCSAADPLTLRYDQAAARWTEALGLPPLSRWQVCREDYPRIIAQSRGSSMKTNPMVLRDDEVAQILDARLN